MLELLELLLLELLLVGCPHLFPPGCFLGLPAAGEEGGQYWELALDALEPPKEIGEPPVLPASAATPPTRSTAASTGLTRRDLTERLRARGRAGRVPRCIASSFIRSSSSGVGSARSRRRRSATSRRSPGSGGSWRGAINDLYEPRPGFLTDR